MTKGGLSPNIETGVGLGHGLETRLGAEDADELNFFHGNAPVLDHADTGLSGNELRQEEKEVGRRRGGKATHDRGTSGRNERIKNHDAVYGRLGRELKGICRLSSSRTHNQHNYSLTLL